MSRLLDVTDELRNLHAELAALEKATAAHPGYDSLSIDYHSLSKRQGRLEAEFQTLASEYGLDVVSYRLVPKSSDNVPLRAVAKALDRFQAAISTIYDARKTGPKIRPKLSAEVHAESGFNFGYSFAGSLGVVLTVPNERMLIDGSDLDYAVEDFFEAAETQSTEGVKHFAHKYGVSFVRRLYEWSAAHADFNIAADIHWLQKRDTRGRLQAAPETLRKLKRIIEETSDSQDEPASVIGRLSGLDTENKTFHLVVGDDDIEGEWADSFYYDAKYVLDETYKSDLIKRTKIQYALDKEETKWLLVALEGSQTDP